jgi:RES domain-containing protein
LTHTVWRIAVETAAYAADDLSGKGAEQTGGRWNAVGAPLVYASSAISLACMETVVHLNAGALPLRRFLVKIDIPDEVWARAEVGAPPAGWDAEPAGSASIGYGTQWARSARSALLLVPSVIVPEERNVLINPLHADAALISAAKLRTWRYDPRPLKPVAGA